MPGKEWEPKIVKTWKTCGDVERSDFNFAEHGALEQLLQRLGLTQRETTSLVVCGGSRVNEDGGIPKFAKEASALGIIPDINGDASVVS